MLQAAMPKVVLNPLWKGACFEMEFKPPHNSTFKDPYPPRFLTEDAMQRAYQAFLENDWPTFNALRVQPFLIL